MILFATTQQFRVYLGVVIRDPNCCVDVVVFLHVSALRAPCVESLDSHYRYRRKDRSWRCLLKRADKEVWGELQSQSHLCRHEWFEANLRTPRHWKRLLITK